MLTKMFCMRLHTGGMVIGYLGIVCGFISIITLSVALGCVENIADKLPFDSVTEMALQKSFVIMSSILLAILVLWFLSSILLVIGTMKNRHFLILPWLVNSILFMVFSFIGDVLFCIILATNEAEPEYYVVPILYLFPLALYVYIYYAIYSLFAHIRTIQEENDYNVVHTADKSTNNIL